jgi:LPS export ABC transporter protein LptC
MAIRVRRSFIYLFVWTLIALLAALGCSRKAPQGESDDETRIATNLPDQILHHSDIVVTKRGSKEVVIHSVYLEKYLSRDSTLMVKIDALFYDSLGAVASALTADSGIVRENTQQMEVWSNVKVVSQNGVTLEADSLQWDQKRNQVITESFVKITYQGNEQTGFGLESDARLTNFRIKRDVRARIEDAEKPKRK